MLRLHDTAISVATSVAEAHADQEDLLVLQEGARAAVVDLAQVIAELGEKARGEMVRINATASEVREAVGRAPTGWGWFGLTGEWGAAGWGKTLMGNGAFGDASGKNLRSIDGVPGADVLHLPAAGYFARLLLRCLFHPLGLIVLSLVFSCGRALLVGALP